jgi:Protein of unknown function (DUF 659)/hAT family C-terminal dimerisation region/BED zinc finger
VKWGCNYCKKVYVRNTTRQEEHLESKCPQYKRAAHPSKKRNVGQLKPLSHQPHSSSSDMVIEAAPSVWQINFPTLTEPQKHTLDLDAAMSVYMGNHPFTKYENRYEKQFLFRLNPAYKPPTCQAIASDLLEEIYSNVKGRTDVLIKHLDRINVSLDETTNIRSNRIVNISIHSVYSSLHYLSKDVRSKRMTGSATAEWLRDDLLVLSNQRLDRVNSIVNDTCSTMRLMWSDIEKFDNLRHCFFIPCDSHRIQLLVKDILKLRGLNNTLQQAQCLAKSFRNAPLQYARLRDFQMEKYGKHQSLILSVMTRWGTQYFLVQSLINNKDAIKRYSDEFSTLPVSERIKQPALEAIRSTEFWVKLEVLRELLKPIDECLRMSESGKSHLGHVLHRWKDILKHLRNRSWENEEIKSFVEEGGFMARYNRQVFAIHITAFYLMPATAINDICNDSIALPINFEIQITDFIKRYSPSAEAAKAAVREFMLFRTQQPPFEPVRQCWQEHEDAHLFWTIGMGLAKNIGTIALRLFSAPVNSVASERAFSVQNIIHNKTRNRLKPVKADKLSFIYSNARILDRDDVPITPIPDNLASKPMCDLTPDEQVTVEGYLLELEGSDEVDAEGEIEEEDDSDEEGDGEDMEKEW